MEGLGTSDRKTLGGGRFELRANLASGAFGDVFVAYDQVLGTEVALKVLHRLGPEAVLSFKNEFRRLSDVRHPNLVRLGELFEEGGQFFFSMELLSGVDLWTWVRDDRQAAQLDEGRLRDALLQLCTGLSALHASGLVHRDLKPDNIRVQADGRVVIFDFGLVFAFDREGGEPATLPSGTAVYMAPEQAVAGRAGPEVDMYSVGIILFELLTGHLPFMGSSTKILLDKSQVDPPRAKERSLRVAPDLDRLCFELMARDPALRPTAQAVLSRLGHLLPASTSLRPDEDRSFVGREKELTDLLAVARAAFAGTRELVLIEGESGVGKTALLRELLGRLRGEHRDLVVLRGRCHPREQLRFNALDELLDELSTYLSGLSAERLATILPERSALLVDLFPVLGRVPGLSERKVSRPPRGVERHEVFLLLVDLLTRLARGGPLVLVIDDLHWGDDDSLSLLRVLGDLLVDVPLLLVWSLRGLEQLGGEHGARLRALAQRPHTTRFKLTPLSECDARALGALLLRTAPDDPRVQSLAQEALGHPLFLTELAEHTQVGAAPAPQGQIDLDAMLSQRIAKLLADSRLTLELISVAGAPVSAGTLALALRSEGLDAALADLRIARFVRDTRGGALICYHDRIREAVLSRLTGAERAALHRRLALAYERTPEVDPAVVADHWLATTDPGRAASWLMRAADSCVARGAFERAAGLYERLLEFDDVEADERHRLELAFAESLAGAGRCAEAARVLLRALVRAGSEERSELSRLAAQRLLQAAEVEAGVAAARDALELVGLSLATGTATALLRLGVNRAMLTFAGLDAAPPERDTSTDLTRTQLDTLWRLAQPLGWADLLSAADVAAQHVRLARKTGERRHLALALSAESVFACMADPESDRSAVFMARADELVQPLSAPDVRGYHAMAQGQLAFFRWDLPDAERLLLRAEQCFHDECPAEAWLLTNARSVLLGVWLGLGAHKRLAQRTDAWLSHAHAVGDRFALASIGVIGFGFLRHLMRDAPDEASHEVRSAMQPWSGTRFGIQHFGEAIAEHSIRLATQAGPVTHAYWESVWPRFQRSFILRLTFVREVVLVARARACLLAAATSSARERKRWVVAARSFVQQAGLGRTRFGRATIAQSEAELALLEGKQEDALRHAREAQRHYGEAHHFGGRLLDYTVGRIEGGDAGRARSESVLRWLSAEGWSRPEQCVQLFAPTVALWR